MADIEPPSFSLGLDLDEELQPQIEALNHSTQNPAPDACAILHGLGEDASEIGLQVMDSDPDSGPDQPRTFKRLRRGLVTRKSPASKRDLEPSVINDRDDDIEEFSSQEDMVTVVDPPTKYHSACSTSKMPLRGSGVLTTKSSTQGKVGKKQLPPETPACGSLEVGQNGLIFPKLTISPLRRFQLIDSDSDDMSVSEDINKGANKTDSSSKKQQSISGEQKRKASLPDNEDLWKEFPPMNNFRIPTPAFDEVFEEYFQSAKDKNAAQKLGGQKFEQQCNPKDPSPPAHCYFFHDDLRIRKLVSDRLPFFSPLGVVDNGGNQQSSASVIDYMGQFCNGETSKQKATQKISSQNCSTSRRNKSTKPKAEDVLHPSEGWVDPKSSAAVPKNAGKRRVHANGQSAGHWYTSPEGRKVYVTKTGQELTGQVAYRHYRKESGAGRRKTKKKSNAKKRKG
ncbi:hypothetical protein SLA2020_322070 [Shorea laevis]